MYGATGHLKSEPLAQDQDKLCFKTDFKAAMELSKGAIISIPGNVWHIY